MPQLCAVFSKISPYIKEGRNGLKREWSRHCFFMRCSIRLSSCPCRLIALLLGRRALAAGAASARHACSHAESEGQKGTCCFCRTRFPIIFLLLASVFLPSVAVVDSQFFILLPDGPPYLVFLHGRPLPPSTSLRAPPPLFPPRATEWV